MNIVFITQDEPFYIPLYFNKILSKLDKSRISSLRVYALQANIYNKSFLGTLAYYFSFYGPVIFGYLVLCRIKYLVLGLMQGNDNLHSLNSVCRKHKVAFNKIDSLNQSSFIAELSMVLPDVIFSVASPQAFPKKLLSLPVKGCINVHSSMLPRYRGVNAGFWVMAKGENVTGVSLHYMNDKLDDGDIIMQQEIKIDDRWSLNDLYMEFIESGSSMISRFIITLGSDMKAGILNDKLKGSYYSFPTASDVKEFRDRGKRFFRYY